MNVLDSLHNYLVMFPPDHPQEVAWGGA